MCLWDSKSSGHVVARDTSRSHDFGPTPDARYLQTSGEGKSHTAPGEPVPDNPAPPAVAPVSSSLARRCLLQDHMCAQHQHAGRLHRRIAPGIFPLHSAMRAPTGTAYPTRHQGRDTKRHRQSSHMPAGHLHGSWITSCGSRPLADRRGLHRGTRYYGSGTSFSIFVLTGARLSVVSSTARSSGPVLSMSIDRPPKSLPSMLSQSALAHEEDCWFREKNRNRDITFSSPPFLSLNHDHNPDHQPFFNKSVNECPLPFCLLVIKVQSTEFRRPFSVHAALRREPPRSRRSRSNEKRNPGMNAAVAGGPFRIA